MDTFAPPVEPSTSVTRATRARVVTSQFGEGYEQRVGIGLNRLERTVELSWDVLSHADAADIIADLEGWAGVEAFEYAAAPETTTRRWVCQQWSRSEAGPMAASLRATLREVMDL